MSLFAALLDEDTTRLSSQEAEVWIAIRVDQLIPKADGTAGSGTQADPYDGSTPDRFDAAMRAAPANARIHIGPGSFPTRGGTAGDFVLPGLIGWTPKPGQKIQGSGIFTTSILLYPWDQTLPLASLIAKHYIIATPVFGPEISIFTSNFEVSDLTLDCNQANQPFAMEANPLDNTMISACGIAASGDKVRIRRVRIINFGSRSPVNYNGTENKYPWPDGPAIRTFEGFPIRIGGRRIRRFGPPIEGNDTPNSQDMVSFHDVFEDCIMEQPYPSNAREVTNVMVGGLLNGVRADQNPPEALHRQPAASLMRRNYLNYDFINERPGNQIRVKQVEILGTVAPVTVRITCQFPHLVKAGEFGTACALSQCRMASPRAKPCHPPGGRSGRVTRPRGGLDSPGRPRAGGGAGSRRFLPARGAGSIFR